MIIYIPPQKEWVWTERIKKFFDTRSINYVIFAPGKGKLGLAKNFIRFLAYWMLHPRSSVLISFASTNGYLASFVPGLKYTLIVHGSDVLLNKKNVLERTRRALSRASHVYIASASRYVSKRIGISTNQVYEWGISEADIPVKPDAENKLDQSIKIAGLRHIREHYLPKKTIETFIQLEALLGNTEVYHFAGKASEKDMIEYNLYGKEKGLDITVFEDLRRIDYLNLIRTIDIGVSLTKSDLYGGPVLEMLYFGNYVIVDRKHPLLELKSKYILEGLVSIKDINAHQFDFSVESKRRRILQYNELGSMLDFEKSMQEIISEYL